MCPAGAEPSGSYFYSQNTHLSQSTPNFQSTQIIHTIDLTPTTMSENTSPVTVNFAHRSHLRYPSSTSSIESPQLSSVVESPASPTFSAPNPKASKRSLPDVEEEPQEPEEDFDMYDDEHADWDCLCRLFSLIHRNVILANM